MNKKLLGLLFTLFVAVTYTSIAQPLTQKLPVDPHVKIGKLANGLTYYIRQNKKPENKVELRLVVNAGSVLEDNDEQGLAHFTEHMAFNGSEHFEKNELVNFLQSIGVQFGADLNAYTSFDETVYILPIPLTDTANFRKGLTVLRDWAGGLSFDSSQIDGERNVVLEESRLGKGADDRMTRKVFPVQFKGSKYAERIPIGKDSIIRYAKYDVVKRFYRDWYRPDLMAVIIVGDINTTNAEKLLKEYFSNLKNPVHERSRMHVNIPARTKSQAVVVTDKEATNYIIQVNYPVQVEKPETTVGDYRTSLVKGLFGAVLNERLTELTQSGNPPFLFASAGFGGVGVGRGYENFTAFAVAGNNGVDTALNALMLEIERAKKYGFTEAELERAKKQLLASYDQSYNNRTKAESAEVLEEYIRNFLVKEPIPGIQNEYTYAKEFLPGIKLSEVNALAAPLNKNENLFVSLQGPESGAIQLPDSTTLLALTRKALNAPVNKYEEKAIAGSLIKTLPQPGAITKEEKDDKLGTTALTFSNGAKVILKPTDFKNDEIILTAFRKGGAGKYPVADKENAAYASTVVQTMGIGDFSPTDLDKVLAGKNASVGARLGNLSAGLSGSSSIKDAETMLQLVYLYLTSPRKDENLFNAWKSKQKSALQFALADPQTAFVDTFYQVLYQNNPLAPAVVPKPATLDKINLDRALAIYKEQFGNANGFTFIMVGNVDIEKLKPLLAKYIGSLPSTADTASFVDNGLRPVKGDVNFTFKKGTEAKSLIVKIYSGEIPYDPSLALKAQALVEVLNIKIIDDIRERLGAIYSGQIYGGMDKLPYNKYSFALQLPSGPEKVDTILKAVDEEIANIKANGPAQKDLDKVKTTWLEQYKVQLKENGFWSGQLQNIYFQGDDPQRIFDYEKNVKALTTDDIKAAANTFFDGQNVLQAVLLPQDK